MTGGGSLVYGLTSCCSTRPASMSSLLTMLFQPWHWALEKCLTIWIYCVATILPGAPDTAFKQDMRVDKVSNTELMNETS